MEKVCRECGKRKPLTDFYTHKMMADGYLNKCKECVKVRVGRHRDANLERIRKYDRERFYNDPERRAYSMAHAKRWAKANPEKMREALYRYPEKRKARVAVGNALRNGRLTRQPCEICGKEKAHAHHEDYAKPLDVRWLCTRCHGREHRAY